MIRIFFAIINFAFINNIIYNFATINNATMNIPVDGFVMFGDRQSAFHLVFLCDLLIAVFLA